MTLGTLLALAVALILAGGAATKLLDLDDFARAVAAYELVPEPLAPTFVRFYPAAELAAALLLLPPATRGWGALLAAAVILAATLGVAVNLRRGRAVIDCGCGGLSGRQPISWWLVARNGLLLLLLLLAALGAAAQPLDAPGVLAGALALALIYAAGDQLLANGLRMRKVSG